jgi:hypothetical protein
MQKASGIYASIDLQDLPESDESKFYIYLNNFWRRRDCQFTLINPDHPESMPSRTGLDTIEIRDEILTQLCRRLRLIEMKESAIEYCEV